MIRDCKLLIELQNIHMDTSTGKVCKTELLKYKKMINFDDYTNENKAEHNPKWPYIPDDPYRILIIGGSGSRKTNALLNLIKISQILIKYISMQKVHMNQNINI